MKNRVKILFVMFIFSLMFVFPKVSNAASLKLDYSCEPIKVNGIEAKKNCTIGFEVDEDSKYNIIELELTLKNLTLTVSNINNDWKINSKIGTGNKIEFQFEYKKNSLKAGKYTIGTFEFRKNILADECDLKIGAFKPSYFDRSCSKVGDIYYGSDGEETNEFEYLDQCFPHKCTILQNEDKSKTYYYDDKGNKTTKEDYESKCLEKHYCEKYNNEYYDSKGNKTDEKTFNKECVPHHCEVVDGDYYNSKGEIVSEIVYEKECKPHTCEVLSDGTKYGKNGDEVDDLTYSKECETHKCEVLSDGTRFGKNGEIVDDITYRKECEKLSCEVLADGTFFDKDGNEVDEQKYKESCGLIKCEKLLDGTYYGKNGEKVDKNTYRKECEKIVCEVIDNEYYDKDGNIVTKDEYLKSCDLIENPKTGLSMPIIILSLSFLIGMYIYLVLRKQNKFMK